MIPYIDLRLQYESIKSEIDAAVLGVLSSSQFILGREVQAFEDEFAAYCQANHAIGVNSGTSALHLALLAVGVKPGDQVITTPFSFAATAAAIYYAGGTPRYVDIDPRTFNMRPDLIEQAITSRTRAILPVHLYGQPADMDAINGIALRHNLAVVEDAAQAHGAEYKGRRAGRLGDIACFSFYPTKNLSACGEGGAVVTNNHEYARTVRLLRDWGSERKYYHTLRGFNYRLEGMQGAILRVKLRHLERWTEARRSHADAYGRLLKDLPVQLPQPAPGTRHVYHAYTLRTAERDRVNAALQSGGIGTGVHYPVPIYLQEAYKEADYPEGSCPNSESAAREVLSLPMFPELTSEQIQGVSEAVIEAVSRSQDASEKYARI